MLTGRVPLIDQKLYELKNFCKIINTCIYDPSYDKIVVRVKLVLQMPLVLCLLVNWIGNNYQL